MLSKIVTLLISPLGTSLILSLLGLFFLVSKRTFFSIFFISLSFVWLVFWSLPATYHWLYRNITADYPQVDISKLPKASAIVVLGGGVSAPNSLRFTPDLTSAADRVWYAAELYKAGKSKLVVLSGGVTSHDTLVSEGAAMEMIISKLGVPKEAIMLEDVSLNTHENAIFTHKLLTDLNIKYILLVTSAIHMKRASIEFKQQGFEVIPAATDYSIEPLMGWLNFMPTASALDNNARAIKELIGTQFIRFR